MRKLAHADQGPKAPSKTPRPRQRYCVSWLRTVSTVYEVVSAVSGTSTASINVMPLLLPTCQIATPSRRSVASTNRPIRFAKVSVTCCPSTTTLPTGACGTGAVTFNVAASGAVANAPINVTGFASADAEGMAADGISDGDIGVASSHAATSGRDTARAMAVRLVSAVGRWRVESRTGRVVGTVSFMGLSGFPKDDWLKQ